MFYYRMLLWN